jgi:DNA-binding response OmpR family regulator
MPKSILLVDDDEGLLALHQLALRGKNDFDVRTALTGREAIEQANRWQPDLVILDMMMPDMNGVDICRHLRAQPALAKVPIIMLTGFSHKETRLAALDAGANDVWLKPITPSQLIAGIRRVLGQLPAPG